MESQKIITNIRSIHAQFPVPGNLRRHLLNVASVGALVADHWIGPAINKTDLVAYLLLHDLGNLVKMHVPSASLLDPNDTVRVDYWLQQQEETWKTYGKDDYKATLAMVAQLGIAPRVLQLIIDSDWHEMPRVAIGNDWEQKIGKYADYRVGPRGILTLHERIEELRIRYKGRLTPEEESKISTFETAVHTIGAHVRKNMRITEEDINDDTVAAYRKKF